MAEEQSAAAAGGDGPLADMAGLKSLYNNKDADLMTKFWAEYYNPTSTSVWTMTYDEPDCNETLPDTIAIATEFMNKMTPAMKDHCFGMIHTLDSLEVEGIWFFNGPDPEKLFGSNEDTSWFTWSQVGPEASDAVKQTVATFMTPTDGKLHGKTIEDTQAFS
mmetsp:Transcript_11762/g.24513  ORF Transcript_11762/g.24513 Transcript_11762/m.24513 type:complete len:162 (-) Transcript_11762:325-810(-)|eukprot:CAMPEP_0183307880 /NCGR_PEP_ID=MMETSP0160_2-20130417/19608_1 /TAXON_ID=2839 ORGANISM="Odontella Sinensis, Strain Grunow 1884" /NCGR_SAMPLE_ID=MMETSP0160_2 /ASSEMBLY_ACC=CAM_ASM_000250 /LENGTH=161 /DNA_ID=CAMNT_0025471589 /DNA_START=74 /DNA_END=559 /DNA_ORIENTATION=+